MADHYEVLKSAVREWQDAKEALDQAMQAWVNAPIEEEKKLVDRVLAAEKRLMEL